jgi:hypothetical protein
VDQPDPLADQRIAKVRRRIDEQDSFRQTKHDAASPALVSRIRALADIAPAADYRNAMRRARAEEEELVAEIAWGKWN